MTIQLTSKPGAAQRERWLRSALVASWLGFAASVWLRPTRGEFDPWLDAGLYNVSFVLAAIASARRARTVERAGAAWGLMATGLVMYSCGNLYGSLVIGDQDIYPSPADAFWLGFYVLAYGALVVFVRSGSTRFHASTWLDGAVVGIGSAALVAVFALGPVLADTSGRFAVVATNIAYPVADLLLIIAMVTWGTVQRSRAASWWWLSAGLALFGIGDVVFLFQSARDTYAEGGLLDVSWPLGAVGLGLAACATPGNERVVVARRPPFFVPATFTTMSLALLIYGQRRELPAVTVVLAAATLVVAAIRTTWTVREVQNLAVSRHEARTDDLTGLANRRAFIEAIDDIIDDPRRRIVMILDLNGFKKINDEFGHHAGDQVLRDVAQRLAAALPAATLARLGGDEFGVVTDGHPDAVADDMGFGELRAALDRPFVIGATAVRVEPSIGVAIHPLPTSGRTELLRAADLAMYTAKRTGTHVHVHDPDRPTASLAGLREAITNRCLELHYQPTVNIARGEVDSVEALVRYRHEGALLYPADFLDEVDRNGLSTDLTDAVLEQAIAFHHALGPLAEGVALRVNISARDLDNQRLTGTVAQLLRQHSMSPDALILEITETTLIADIDTARSTTAALRELGVRVSVDDFGVGYSSMSQLLTIDIDELKLDRAFAGSLCHDTRTRAVVESSIRLARALNIQIVAEGIETADAATILAELGCDTAQGYHISRPLPPSATRTFLSNRACPASMVSASNTIGR